MKPLANCMFSAALACTASAQCAITSLDSVEIGPGCNAPSTGLCAIPPMPTEVRATLDDAACRLDIELVVFVGCGVTAPLRALAIGFQPLPAPLSLPAFGVGCLLHVTPDALVTATTGVFSLPLPPTLPTATIYVQGFALSVDPLGDVTPTVSPGVRCDLG